jgi:phosphocarrier protein NPr
MVIRFELTYPLGIHARPSVALVNLLKPFDAQIIVTNAKGDKASARSVLELLSLGMQAGQVIEFDITGPNENEASTAITNFINKLNIQKNWE